MLLLFSIHYLQQKNHLGISVVAINVSRTSASVEEALIYLKGQQSIGNHIFYFSRNKYFHPQLQRSRNRCALHPESNTCHTMDSRFHAQQILP